MRWRRLLESTRPVPKRYRGATSGDPVRRPPVRSRRLASGRPTRGAKPRSSVPKPRRHRRRINWTRITAAGMSLFLAVGVVWLAAGPWLQVRAVTVDGAGWTPKAELHRLTDVVVGRSTLLVDADSLAGALGELPAVESARVDVGILGTIHVTLVEGGAVAVWRTSAASLLLAEDGTVVGIQSRDATPTGATAGLPRIDDQRDASHDLVVGDAVPQNELEAALILAALPGPRLGSASPTVSVAVDPTYGFVLSAPAAGWQAAFGFYGLDPTDTPELVAARIESQTSAVRTLFSLHPEAGVAWVDARNPGRVYFRARG
jgi:hypothetical protein